MCGLEGASHTRMCGRSMGPRMVMQPALGRPGIGTAKVSAISVAWRTIAGWLVDVLRSLIAGAPAQVQGRARKSSRLLSIYDWSYLGSAADMLLHCSSGRGRSRRRFFQTEPGSTGSEPLLLRLRPAQQRMTSARPTWRGLLGCQTGQASTFAGCTA